MIVVIECKKAEACPALDGERTVDSDGLSLLTVADDFVVVFGWRGGYRSSRPELWPRASSWAEPSRWGLAPGPGGEAVHAKLQKVWRGIQRKYPRVDFRAAWCTYHDALWASGRDCTTGRDILVFEGSRGQFYAHSCGWEPTVDGAARVVVFTTMPETVDAVAARVFERLRIAPTPFEAVRQDKPANWRHPSGYA